MNATMNAWSSWRKSAKLPNFSAMMQVGQLRRIQCAKESGEYWNPDMLVSRFLSPSQRWSCFWRGELLLRRLRSDPFYYYVVARTRYYDEVFIDAMSAGVQRIVNVGCGIDTRAYRYAHLLSQKGIGVLECDQAGAIEAKQQIARRHLPVAHVEYMPIDLNNHQWPQLQTWMERNREAKTLVLIEGVSPYIAEPSFSAFLGLLAGSLCAGSRVAYDFKYRGARDGWGPSQRAHRPFRLSTAARRVRTFHEALGFVVQHVETSAELSLRLLPSLKARESASTFNSDGLVQLEIPVITHSAPP